MTKYAPLELARPGRFRRGIAFAALLAALLHFGVVKPASAESPQRIQPSRINAARLRWFQYKLVAGRILVTSTYPEGMNISFGPSTTDTNRREQLQLLILADRASISYELTGEDEELTIQLTEAGEFSIHHTRSDPPLTVSFVQAPERPLSLVVRRDGVSQEVVGDSFWHLYLAAPGLVGQELVPYLETLRPAWQLVATGERLERNLMQRARQPNAQGVDQWRELIARLASANFAEREAAQHQLAAIGQAVLPFLQDLDPTDLDAEQAARVRKLIENLRVNYEDSADRVANWLIGDVSVWLSLAGRPKQSVRDAARQQLVTLTGESIVFDPAADEEVRAAQLARLSSRLLLPQKATRPHTEQSVPPPAVER
jgi:hypothetical protein